MSRFVLALAGWSTGQQWSGLAFGVSLYASLRRVDVDEVRASRYFTRPA